MAAHSRIFAWRIPWKEESGRLWSMGLQRFGHNSSDLRRRRWQPTPVLLPGNSHGRRSLVGCSPWGCEELDMTKWLHFHFSLSCIGEGTATHSTVLAWRVPGSAEPDRLPSMGSHRVRHDWSDLAAAATTFMPLPWSPSKNIFIFSLMRCLTLLHLHSAYSFQVPWVLLFFLEEDTTS